MRILHVCFADSDEGGAIGAYRLHKAMLSQGLDSRFLAIRKRREDATVITPGIATRVLIRFWNLLSIRLLKFQKNSDKNYRSLNLFPTGVHKIINAQNPDIVQCHWINRNSISIKELTKIEPPVFLKLPDMWAFTGTEHYLNPGARERYREGYSRQNRLAGDRGIDLDRWVWRYKKNVWKRAKFTIVTPSKWLGECAGASTLFRDYRIASIANPIDFEIYRPFFDKRDARIALGLPFDKKLILFGSIHADTDRRKGYHHLRSALSVMRDREFNSGDFEFMIFGTKEEKISDLEGTVAHYLGSIRDERLLVTMYAAADVMVLPTEADNLPNTVQEATSCGTPCVGFDVGGLPDMIRHKETGYLARPFDHTDLANGIEWVLTQNGPDLSRKVREGAKEIFDPEKRVADYISLYREVRNQ